jgi:hypothetical protein
MKLNRTIRTLCLLIALLLIGLTLVGCRKPVDMYMTDGVDYRNTDLKIEYVSSEVVRVTFTADVYAERATVRANVVLLSEGSVIGRCELELRPGVGEEHVGCSVTKDVPVTYHNYGTVTAVVDSINAYYVQYQ